jgi:hypothetical protein
MEEFFPWITSGQLGWPVEQRALSLLPRGGVVKRVYRPKAPLREGLSVRDLSRIADDCDRATAPEVGEDCGIVITSARVFRGPQ